AVHGELAALWDAGAVEAPPDHAGGEGAGALSVALPYDDEVAGRVGRDGGAPLVVRRVRVHLELRALRRSAGVEAARANAPLRTAEVERIPDHHESRVTRRHRHAVVQREDGGAVGPELATLSHARGIVAPTHDAERPVAVVVRPDHHEL